MIARLLLASSLVLGLLTTWAAAESPELQTGAAFRKELVGPTDIFWKDQRALSDALA